MENKMSGLLKLYDIELGLLFKSNQTKLSYKSALNKFINENSRCYRMSIDDLKKYFSEFKNRYSDSYYNVICSATKLFYCNILKQPNKFAWFKPIKTEKQFHDIIKDSEFIAMMKATNNIKHKMIIMLLFSTGIRRGELLDIELKDLDFDNNRILIHTEKGGKNRYVPIHELSLRYIIKYFKEWKPTKYLVEGKSGCKYSATSVYNIVKSSSRYIDKNIYPHLFRHTLISKTIENEDVFLTMEIAGHRNLKSTLNYNHIAPERMRTMYNPLNNIK